MSYHIELPPDHELNRGKPWRERIIIALVIGYLMFSIAIFLDLFPAQAWTAAVMLFFPLIIVALLEKP